MSIYTRDNLNHHNLNRKNSLGWRGLPQSFFFILGDLSTSLFSYIVAQNILNLAVIILPLKTTLVWIAVWIMWRAYQGLYPGYGKSLQTELRLHTISTAQLAIVQLAGALTLQKFSTNAIGILVVWFFILILTLVVRSLLRVLMIRLKSFGRPISIIGTGQSGRAIVDYLLQNPEYGLRPIAIYDDNSQLEDAVWPTVPILGTVSRALSNPITEQAIVTLSRDSAQANSDIISKVYATFPITWVVPDLLGMPNQALQSHNIGSTASIEIKNNLRSIRTRTIKRLIDFTISLLGIIVISPILLIIAIFIKLDSPGPAVYRARRLGKDGQFFDCFKFRSMHCDAEAKLKDMLAAYPHLQEEFAATHKLKDDPRITHVGAFLRKTSLDEFPQLFNVISGEMSLVGPRPIVQTEIEKYGEIYETYKQVRPGMTGYWQVNGRSDTSYSERVAMDKFYVTNWSPWLDITILIQTVRVVFLGKGAY